MELLLFLYEHRFIGYWLVMIACQVTVALDLWLAYKHSLIPAPSRAGVGLAMIYSFIPFANFLLLLFLIALILIRNYPNHLDWMGRPLIQRKPSDWVCNEGPKT